MIKSFPNRINSLVFSCLLPLSLHHGLIAMERSELDAQVRSWARRYINTGLINVHTLATMLCIRYKLENPETPVTSRTSRINVRPTIAKSGTRHSDVQDIKIQELKRFCRDLKEIKDIHTLAAYREIKKVAQEDDDTNAAPVYAKFYAVIYPSLDTSEKIFAHNRIITLPHPGRLH